MIYRHTSRKTTTLRIVGLLFWGTTTGSRSVTLMSRRQKHLLIFSKMVNRKRQLAQLNNNDTGQDFSLEKRLKRVKKCLSKPDVLKTVKSRLLSQKCCLRSVNSYLSKLMEDNEETRSGKCASHSQNSLQILENFVNKSSNKLAVSI